MIEFRVKRDWEGNADDLAQTAGEIFAALALGNEFTTPNVRLIRDYGQRNILSKPTRRGKEAIYAFRHLLEFVAARVLASEGWPLAKIAEQCGHSSDEELLGYAHIKEKENSSPEATHRLARKQSATRPMVAHKRKSASDLNIEKEIAPTASSEFSTRLARTSSLQVELDDALRKLGLPTGGPAAEQVTVIAIAPWCQVLVETNRLSRITMDEATEVGRAITASLLSPTIRKART